MSVRAFISGCASLELTADERAFFRDTQPWGLILFRRNIEKPAQVMALTADFRDCVGRTDAPVLVDQEGGRVQRMGPPHWPVYPPGATFGRLRANDSLHARELARLGARLMAADLRAVGITCNCAPVLDVPSPGAHAVIGDRAYGPDADTVAVLGRAVADGLLAGGVLPVIKHIPGHGRAGADSHHDLPVVDADIEALRTHDFAPFAVMADMPAAMTAHVVFTALDPARPATVSRRVVRDIIRREIGFDGLLMTDDLSMKALRGTLAEKSGAAIRAGCDMLLHCNGVFAEMEAVAAAAPELRGKAARRAQTALARIAHRPEPLEVVDARARFAAALAA